MTQSERHEAWMIAMQPYLEDLRALRARWDAAEYTQIEVADGTFRTTGIAGTMVSALISTLQYADSANLVVQVSPQKRVI